MGRALFPSGAFGMAVFMLASHVCAQESTIARRETVLDRKVHIEEELVLDIPKAPRLCDALEAEKGPVDIGDCRLYCEREGSGMPLVLLHGGPGATHHCFHPYFSHAADFAKVVYYDQRGCGLSEYKEGEGYSIDQAVDDLDKLRKALGIDKWVVLGHSYGGLLAQCYAVKYPERLAGLVLVGSSMAARIPLDSTRQYDFLSPEEQARIGEIHSNRGLSMAQSVFNAHLNGDWKRQNYYRPSRERLAQVALYEWVHDPRFRRSVGQDTSKMDLKEAFETCPIPTIVMEGEWDLTWNTDKRDKLHKNHPKSRLIVFETSSHNPFEDEPERFFAELKGFVNALGRVAEADIESWRTYLTGWKRRREESLANLVLSTGCGRKSNEKMAAAYSKERLGELGETRGLLKMGFALYDVARYEDALDVFRKMADVTGDNEFYLAVALIWQGHMLDLMGKRDEAIAVYEKAADMNVSRGMRHDQFGLAYSPSPYAAERLNTPFTRLENRAPD
ncbi:MAG TPA: alpha/beta fold hydrolase [Candidatus Hydrogenedentes bacterium]|nr:alpha/beta fold hydrolase [Candidatus Hydrogenedentota bacterium]